MPDDNCRHLLEYIPFLGLMTGKTQMATPLTTRLVETAIMSAVAGGFAVYVGVEVLKSDINYIKASIQEVNLKVDKLENNLDRVKSDLYVPRGK
jgi:outer membrane murein-binding lipoprotein Lpp